MRASPGSAVTPTRSWLPTANGPIPVDTGFIVYNERNYPEPRRPVQRARGRDSCLRACRSRPSLDGGELEYSGTGLNGLMAQRGNVVRPRFWRMMRDILRFYRQAPDVLQRTELARADLGRLSRPQRLRAGVHRRPPAADGCGDLVNDRAARCAPIRCSPSSGSSPATAC